MSWMIQNSCQWIKFWKQLYKGNQFWYPLCPEWFKFPVNESSFGNSCKGICLWYPVSRRIIECFGKVPRIILFIYWYIWFSWNQCHGFVPTVCHSGYQFRKPVAGMVPIVCHSGYQLMRSSAKTNSSLVPVCHPKYHMAPLFTP